MKKKKATTKLLSLLMMAVMIISMLAVNVSAADVELGGGPKQGSLTLKVNKETKDKNSTYSVYKVLDAAMPVGQDVYEYKFTEAFKKFATADPAVTVDAIAGLKHGNMDYTLAGTGTADELAAKLENYVLNNPAVIADYTMTADEPKTLDPGYYLVLETGRTEGFKTTKPILVGIPTDRREEMEDAPQYEYDMVITLKDQHIPITKTIEESREDLKESIAQQVGKEYTYVVEQPVPKYDDTFNKIVFSISDTMSKGLDFVEVVSVKAVSGENTETSLTPNEAQNGYGWEDPAKSEDGTTTLTFDFSDNTVDGGNDYYDSVKNANKVVITYKAKLNKDATFGPTGNTNEVVPTFGNNPGSTTSGDKDVTITYAGLLEIIKKNAKGETLEGTEFGVYEDEECIKSAELVTYQMDKNGVITPTRNPDLSAIAKTDKNGVVRFEGLGDRVEGEGTDYWIKEINSTSGYVLLKEPIELIVKVDHPEGIKNGTEIATFTYEVKGNGVYKVAVDSDSGKVTVDVINQQGFTLPITGGNGIYLFIACGVIFFIAAAVMILKPRKKLDK